MYLNVILTILVVTLISITVLLTIWWKKYGKSLFGGGTNLDLNRFPLPKLNDIGKIMSQMDEMMKKTKKR